MKHPSQFLIRTSDRRIFRRCLRKWDFQSSLRQNLTRTGTEQNINFWFGSAIHFCLEDYHGYNRFENPQRALYAYYNAFPPDELPVGAEVYYDLGLTMLDYYLKWFSRHNQQTGFETVWLDPKTYTPMSRNDEGAEPAVEVSFCIPLHVYAIIDVDNKIIGSFYYNPKEPYKTKGSLPSIFAYNNLLAEWTPDNPVETTYFLADGRLCRIIPVNYHGTIDRIVIDRYGRYWLMDYKTAKSADTAKLATDDQVTAYLWAARKLFPFPVYGFVYVQMTKDKPQPPKRLKDGTLSVDKRQHTTYGLVKQEILRDYGDVNKAPAKLIQFLNDLAEQETPEGDRFIRWDFVKRTPKQLDATEQNIYSELSIMLNPNLYCYPSPTRDCIWDCPLRDACILMDTGDKDALEEFLKDFEKRSYDDNGNEDAWRQRIKWPELDENNKPTLVPMEEVLNYTSTQLVDLENTENPEELFKFYYEEEC